VIPLADLPAVNAALNATTALLLTTGFVMVRRRKLTAHKACMLAAFAVSTVFLASYLYYHAHAGIRHFNGQGWIRLLYLVILLSHTLLAAAVLPLAVITAFRGLAGRFPKHQRIARWTLPIWLYVSVTGVVVYLLLYRLSF
jgi:uncharacterized membrane protein YozB (DUF420 family)